MKRRAICFFMVCIFAMSTTQPFVTVDAAELWNKGSHKKSNGKTYYNKHKSKSKKKHTLYNSRGISSKNDRQKSISRKNSSSGYGLYKEVRMSKPKASKQWKRMSSSAVSNRLSDVEFALRQEYTILIDVAKKLNEATKKQKKKIYEDNKRFEKRVAKYKRDQEQAKINEELERDMAYARLMKNKGWRKRSSHKNSSNDNRSSSVRVDSSGKKKSTKLYNDIH